MEQPEADPSERMTSSRHALPWRRASVVLLASSTLILLVAIPTVVVTKRKRATNSQIDILASSFPPTTAPTPNEIEASDATTNSSFNTRAPTWPPSTLAPSSTHPTFSSQTPNPTLHSTLTVNPPSSSPLSLRPTDSLVTMEPSSTAPTLPPVTTTPLPSTNAPTVFDASRFPRSAVSRLSLDKFKSNIEILSNFGDRLQGSASYDNAATWVRSQLQAYGYGQVNEHWYSYRNQPRKNLYVTKVGRTRPHEMYILSAHLDGRGGGGAANDDGSGCSLVLEIARVLAAPDIQMDVSVRMIFWNNEETGLNGATAYVNDRRDLQAQPAAQSVYPEPQWLGIITHDQILFDHGLPVQATQSAFADADIEYQVNSKFAAQSRALANSLQAGNVRYAKDYPAEVSSDMCCTDSVPFQDVAPAVSIRENRRKAEIGNGAQPNWHQPTDLYQTYSELDFLFGFNIVQTTLGTISELVNLTTTNIK